MVVISNVGAALALLDARQVLRTMVANSAFKVEKLCAGEPSLRACVGVRFAREWRRKPDRICRRRTPTTKFAPMRRGGGTGLRRCEIWRSGHRTEAVSLPALRYNAATAEKSFEHGGTNSMFKMNGTYFVSHA